MADSGVDGGSSSGDMEEKGEAAAAVQVAVAQDQKVYPLLDGAEKAMEDDDVESSRRNLRQEVIENAGGGQLAEQKRRRRSSTKDSGRRGVFIQSAPTPQEIKMEELQKLRMEPSSGGGRGRAPTISPSDDFSENTPLLAAACSMPTMSSIDYRPAAASVLGIGEAGEEAEDDHAARLLRSTMSEGGREAGTTAARRRRRRSKLRRRASDPSLRKTRPFIASPFIPIATQVSIEPDRRSITSYHARESSGYGSIRRTEEARQRALPPTGEGPGSSSEESDEDEEESTTGSSTSTRSMRKASFASLTGREWVTICMLALANLCSTVAFSCIAPFYPTEAKLKGMSETQTGVVFGAFELVMFIVAPIFGKHMIRIGSKNMFTFGLGLTGVTAIAFGFLNFLPSGDLFFWTSLAIRCTEAIGDAAFVTSSFAISARCFPGRISVVVGVMETFAGLGFTAGPVVGGFLYEYGGFQTPFLVLGGILMLATVLSCFLIEAHDDEPVDEDAKGMLAMLRIPQIWLMVAAIIVCSVSLSFLDPSLAGHLEAFSLSPTMVGLMFLLCGGVYTLASPFWGLLIDRLRCTNTLLAAGAIGTAAAMLLIGPAPFIPLQKNLVLIGISLTVLGAAAGALYIPTFQGCLDVVKLHDFDDSFQTYGCVSGLFQSAFAFGGFIGPTLGGAAVEWIGFEWTTTAIGFIFCAFVVVFFVFHGLLCCSRGPDLSSRSHSRLSSHNHAQTANAISDGLRV